MTGTGKRRQVESLLRQMGSVIIGYSGGVDSVMLAKVAVDTLGPDRVLAVTGRSPSLASWMEDIAADVAERFGIPWLEIETHEIDDPNYASNPTNRCYFCKSELWTRLTMLAEERGYAAVCDGANADDVGDYRPGTVAGVERGVRSPMREAGLTKSEIREWSRDLGLPTWDQPAAPCLASRIPYGLAVTPQRLRQVESGEIALREMGFRDFRVRHHDDVARLEIHPSELDRLPEHRESVRKALIRAGFRRAIVDLDGYRRGALNEGLVHLQIQGTASRTGMVPASDSPHPQDSDTGQVDASSQAATATLDRPSSSPARAGDPTSGVAATSAPLEIAGHDREIGIMRLPADDWEDGFINRAAELSRTIRAAGFRYAALDLDPLPGPGTAT